MQIPKDNRCCPDQVVGKMDGDKLTEEKRQDIDYTFENGKYLARKNVIKKNEGKITTTLEELTNPIAIVLESPHIEEFKGKIGPAKDATGRCFFLHFKELIKKSVIYNEINTVEHDIVFMNSIQYQCSLGKCLTKTKNKKQRDDNWILCFEDENSCDIERRLQAINPFATINLCTQGKGSVPRLRNLQQMLHVKISYMKNYTWGSHPYSWLKEENRFIR